MAGARSDRSKEEKAAPTALSGQKAEGEKKEGQGASLRGEELLGTEKKEGKMNGQDLLSGDIGDRECSIRM